MNKPDHLAPGSPIPSVSFRIRHDGDWGSVTSNEIFAGRTVILFALPGAFTPTCSSTHLPGYLALSRELRAAGVDEIYCLSVNDAFVMNAWAREQSVKDEVIMLPDGNGEFTDGVGMLVDKSDLGFGPRSWRYSMLVRDGNIDKMFVEDFSVAGDPFEVSDAQTMLSALVSSQSLTR